MSHFYGPFYKNVKPVDTAEYMNDFVTDCLTLRTTGITCNDKTYKIELTAGKHGLSLKTLRDMLATLAAISAAKRMNMLIVAARMTFPENAAELHTDHSFRAMMNYEHHNCQSPLTKLSVDMDYIILGSSSSDSDSKVTATHKQDENEGEGECEEDTKKRSAYVGLGNVQLVRRARRGEGLTRSWWNFGFSLTARSDRERHCQ